jgi:uncharacterized protein with GYD domain
MGTYVLLGQYSHEATKGISAKRTEKVNELIEKYGGSMKSGYAMLGKNDLVMILEAPDNASVMKISVALTKMTGIGFTSAPAVGFEEFDQLMEEL